MSDYLLALVEQDAAANQQQAQLIEDLRVSIHEVLTGQTIPASEMWKALESDND